MKSLLYFLFNDLCQVLNKVLKTQEWTGFVQESLDMPRKKCQTPNSRFDFCPNLWQCGHLPPYKEGISVLPYSWRGSIQSTMAYLYE